MDNLYEKIKKIISADAMRSSQDCPECVAAFERMPVAGSWQLGVLSDPIRYHWMTEGEKAYTRKRGICGAQVVTK